jgi:peptide deformylase
VAVLEIITVPQPLLAQEARQVREDEFGEALEQLCSDMAETMYAAPGVGLAAPQVSDSRRIVVLDAGEDEERGKRLRKLVNPSIVERSRETIEWEETCLSVPGIEVMVERHRQVRVQWRQPDGTPAEDWFEDYEAVIVQHELDHLVGTVLLDRVSRFKRGRYLKRVKRRERELVEAHR